MKQPLRVLLLEDSEDDALLELRELRRADLEARARRVDTLSALRAALSEETWDVVIADYRMPELDFSTALAAVRERDPELPFIIVSGALGEEQAVAAVKAGADDYVLKDALPRLGPAVEREVRASNERRRRNQERIAAAVERAALEDQLREARKLEALGRLAGGVAHDVNNLLMVISAEAERMKRRPAAEEDAPRLEEIQRTVARGAELMDQLLNLGRRPAATAAHAAAPLELDAAVRGARELLLGLLGPEVALELDLAAPGATIAASASEIERVLMNLALNARDAMPNGGRLTLRTRRARAAQARPNGEEEVATLTVSDTGAGLTPEARERLFEPYFTTKPAGTGLGLATVQGIVRRARGRIRVTGAPGAGATFTLDFPLIAAPAPAAAPPPRRTQPATILLIEDEDSLRELLAEIFKSRGHQVLAARSGEDALAAAARWPGPIHLLVSDWILPARDGAEVARELRVSRPEIKTLFISGRSQPPPKLGPNSAFLVKPCGLDELFAAMGELLAA